MGFRFEWYDDDQTVMHYIAEGDWNWRDYHSCVRASTFAMHRHPNPVLSLIDLRESTRQTMPSGLAAHVRSFGKKLTPALSGEAVIIGMPSDAQAQLTDGDKTLDGASGTIYFVETEDELKTLLESLRDEQS